MKKIGGTVYLVGAGPGDAGLFTLRGAELLRRAEVVLYDVLVNPALLKLAPATAELISRGRRTSGKALSQEQINELMIARAREGKCVVRLKGGDPYVFGRGGEEAEALAAAHVPFEVVPGVSSIAAVPNYAGIPLTHRDYCSSFTVFTGHEGEPDAESHFDLNQIASTPGTKVILMGLKKLGELAEGLMTRGLAAETPVAIVERGTTGGQRSIAATLGHIAALAASHNFRPPVITVIGDVVNLRGKLNWFEQRPLFSQRIVVTRSRLQSAELTSRLTELGAEVLEVPCIKIVPPTSHDDIRDALLELNSYDWLVFTSPNGVTAFFDLFFKAFKDTRDIGGVRIAAVGPGTAAKLRELHLQVDLMPEEALGVNVAKAFARYESMENLKVCLLRAQVANPDLPRALEDIGAIVDDIACYQTVAETEDANGDAARMLQEGAHWITFTSGSTVAHFHERFDLPGLLRKFPQSQIASIGPETSKAIQVLGLQPKLEAKPHTVEGLVAALLRMQKR